MSCCRAAARRGGGRLHTVVPRRFQLRGISLSLCSVSEPFFLFFFLSFPSLPPALPSLRLHVLIRHVAMGIHTGSVPHPTLFSRLTHAPSPPAHRPRTGISVSLSPSSLALYFSCAVQRRPISGGTYTARRRPSTSNAWSGTFSGAARVASNSVTPRRAAPRVLPIPMLFGTDEARRVTAASSHEIQSTDLRAGSKNFSGTRIESRVARINTRRSPREQAARSCTK